MARPRKDGVDYFPHFVNYGKTVPILKQRFGNDGYAAWFQLLEMLGKSVTHSLDLEDPIEWEFAIASLGIDEQTAEEFFALLAKLHAIDPELWHSDRVIWCQKFVDNLEDLYRKRSVSAPERPALKKTAGVSAPKTPVSAPIMPQSTPQHSKAQQSNSAANAAVSTTVDEAADAEAEHEQDIDPEDPMTWPFTHWKNTVVEDWNSRASPPFQAVKKLTDDRVRHLRTRYGDKQFRTEFRRVFEIVTESEFCRGGGPRGWIASFDWIIRNNGNYVKVLEGKYDGTRQAPIRHRNGRSQQVHQPDQADYERLARERGIIE